MKTPVLEFDRFCGVPLQAEPQTDTKVADLSNCLAMSNHQLEEVWIFRTDGVAMTPEFAQALLHHYQGNEDELLHSAAIHNHLVSEFTFGLKPILAHFHFSLVTDTKYGIVLSVVLGSQQGMSLMYEAGLRSSKDPELSDASD